VVSWPRAVGQEPLYYDALNTGRPAGSIDLTQPPKSGDDKYVSRYIDVPNSPQFPFATASPTRTIGTASLDSARIT